MTFVKGKSGNPSGRPKLPWTMRGLYMEELESILTGSDGSKIEAKKAVAKRLIKMAIDGDIQAIKEINARIDGMPDQHNTTDLTTGGEPFLFTRGEENKDE